MHENRAIAKVRPARASDAGAILTLARTAGSGLTTLPADPTAIEARLAAHTDALQKGSGTILLVLEQGGAVIGTGSVVTRLGQQEPFFSYRVVSQKRRSALTGTCVETRVLDLSTDFVGCAEVGSLFVSAAARKSGAGRLMARSRYLFIASHRPWFADKIIAELRGMQDDDGASPFWDAVGRHFYQMTFAEADLLNGRCGSQIIRELGPKEPVHVELLPTAAQNAIAKVHRDGRRALELLEEEGFSYSGYVDIFDAGPTVVAETSALRTLRERQTAAVISTRLASGGQDCLVSIGHGSDFRCARGYVRPTADGAEVDCRVADILEIDPDVKVSYAAY